MLPPRFCPPPPLLDWLVAHTPFHMHCVRLLLGVLASNFGYVCIAREWFRNSCESWPWGSTGVENNLGEIIHKMGAPNPFLKNVSGEGALVPFWDTPPPLHSPLLRAPDCTSLSNVPENTCVEGSVPRGVSPVTVQGDNPIASRGVRNSWKTLFKTSTQSRKHLVLTPYE